MNNLTTIFRDVFQDPSLVLRPELAAKDVKNWDSVNHINLMIAVEMEYNVVLNPVEVQQARTVGDLVRLLQAKGCQISM